MGTRRLTYPVAFTFVLLLLIADLAFAKNWFAEGMQYMEHPCHCRYIEAARAFSKALENNPNWAEAYYKRGQAYHFARKADYAKAITDYSRALELDPEIHYAYFFRAKAYIKSNPPQYAKAILDYNLAIKFIPERTDFYLYRAKALRGLNQHYLAIEDYTRVIDHGKTHTHYDALRHRGELYLNTKQYHAAIDDFSSALARYKKSYEIYTMKGYAWVKLQAYDQGIQDYTKALELKPNFLPALNYRGLAWAEKGSYEKAIQDFDRALIIDSTYKVVAESKRKVIAMQKRLEAGGFKKESADKPPTGIMGDIVRNVSVDQFILTTIILCALLVGTVSFLISRRIRKSKEDKLDGLIASLDSGEMVLYNFKKDNFLLYILLLLISTFLALSFPMLMMENATGIQRMTLFSFLLLSSLFGFLVANHWLSELIVSDKYLYVRRVIDLWRPRMISLGDVYNIKQRGHRGIFYLFIRLKSYPNIKFGPIKDLSAKSKLEEALVALDPNYRTKHNSRCPRCDEQVPNIFIKDVMLLSKNSIFTCSHCKAKLKPDLKSIDDHSLRTDLIALIFLIPAALVFLNSVYPWWGMLMVLCMSMAFIPIWGYLAYNQLREVVTQKKICFELLDD